MGQADAARLNSDTLALSLSQREVWRDQCAWPGSAHLMIGGGGFLYGPFDPERCKQAVALLARENDALRLAPLEDGTQRLLERFEPVVEVVDFDPTAKPAQAMQAWWQDRVAQNPFRFDGTPPWRFAILRAHDQLHGLVMQFHHVVMDGWGTALVMRRWSEIYSQLAMGGAVPQRDGPSYRQYIEESGEYLASEAFGRDAAYWRSQIPALPRSVIESRFGDQHRSGLAAARMAVLPIARAEYNRLVETAAGQGVSAFNFFLAALALYFARTANQNNVLIGVPTLNRGGRRYRQTPGMFVGVLVLSIHISEGMTLSELVAGVSAAMRGALRHPRYPLSELGRSLQVARSGRDSPFDVLLSFERQDYAVSFGGVDLVDSRQLFSGTARYPLGVTVCEFHEDQDLELVLEGSAACFSDRDVAPLATRLWHMVQEFASAPGARVDTVQVLPPDEWREMVHGRHAHIAWHTQTQPWVSLFEQHVASDPAATSLVWDGGRMDYRTLDLCANQLAHRLVALGAARDRVVAVAIARSVDMIVALLAVAKSGAAFLPLDPDAPVARLATILDESGSIALLIQGASWDRLAHLHERVVVTNWEQALRDNPPANAPARPDPGDLAYVLFTSGSTGGPKGVMVENATLSRRMAWFSRVYGVQAQDRTALATQATFDPSLIEWCLPLIHGASIALAPAGRLHPEVVAEFAIRHGATIMAFVPSTLSGFLAAVAGRADLKLRVACCGGEVLSPELAERYLSGTKARLFNVYGPTEACILATAWECTSQSGSAALPIGSPIDDTCIYVLDAKLCPLPYGTAGEIYIGGAGLARGYLNRPELTREVFLDDPFRPGARMYRSGDRGWLDPDGQLHFLGRLDRQVKLRGYRIELGEIEAALLAVEGVTQAAAKLVEQGGRTQIHAWVATAGGNSPDSLQQVLRVRLPDYMIPGAIGTLAELPTSGAGKTDYDALPEMSDQPPPLLVRGPASQLERDILALWEEVLERRPLTVQDNFFDVGGDSLDAVGILAGVERLLGRKVPLYMLTEHPTVERLALALGTKAKTPSLMVNLGYASDQTPFYLAASGHGDLMRFQNLAAALVNACDLHMLQPPLDEPIKRITDLAVLYADRIQARQEISGFIAGFSIGGIAALETARLLEQRGAPVRGLILIDTIYPKAVWGGTFYWRLFGWLVRRLRIQDLSLNGRRLGAMFNDPGLVGQLMAMGGYRVAAYPGSMVLIKTSGLSRWDRMLFGSWRKLMGRNLSERHIAGLHGSIFEVGNVRELATVLTGIIQNRE